ncbi:MAG: hypothetical protein JNL82_06810 [Myxococcales bacterium]|nr:hypothetical protein [Myxococcales bacterium]
MPIDDKNPVEIKKPVERSSLAGLAVAGGQVELVERLSKVLEELRAAGGLIVGGNPVANWSQEGGWFRDLNDGWGQKGGWVQTNDRTPGALVRPPEAVGRDLGAHLQEPARELGRGVGRVIVKKPGEGG